MPKNQRFGMQIIGLYSALKLKITTNSEIAQFWRLWLDLRSANIWWEWSSHNRFRTRRLKKLLYAIFSGFYLYFVGFLFLDIHSKNDASVKDTPSYPRWYSLNKPPMMNKNITVPYLVLGWWHTGSGMKAPIQSIPIPSLTNTFLQSHCK